MVGVHQPLPLANPRYPHFSRPPLHHRIRYGVDISPWTGIVSPRPSHPHLPTHLNGRLTHTEAVAAAAAVKVAAPALSPRTQPNCPRAEHRGGLRELTERRERTRGPGPLHRSRSVPQIACCQWAGSFRKLKRVIMCQQMSQPDWSHGILTPYVASFYLLDFQAN